MVDMLYISSARVYVVNDIILFSQNPALYLLADEMRYIRERRQLEMEWYQLALLIDRLTFIIFFLDNIAAVAVIETK